MLYDLVDGGLRSSLSQVPSFPLPLLFLLRISPVSFDRFSPISHNMIPDYRDFAFHALTLLRFIAAAALVLVLESFGMSLETATCPEVAGLWWP